MPVRQRSLRPNGIGTDSEDRRADASPAVEIHHLCKIFKRASFEIRALDHISFEIPRGDFVALMGPSGSGKTTLLNIIAGIEQPSSGILRVLGDEILKLNEEQSARWRRAHIGYVFQQFNLVPVLTAFENVELPLLLTGMSATRRKEHVITAMKLVGLEDRLNHLPKHLSGGQNQRVSIARAIVTDPRLLLADEPTGDLDRSSAAHILRIFQRLNEDFHKTIVMVTHDPFAAGYARHTQNLQKGMLVRTADGSATGGYRSQHGQDKFLDEVVFHGKRGGVFVEIGACDGLFFSNTYFFEKERAWTGVCIEPRRSQFESLVKNRSCTCVNLCVASFAGEEEFTEFTGVWLPALSGVEKHFHREHWDTVGRGLSQPSTHKVDRYPVRTDTLTNILKKQSINRVDYCSIDVEGGEIGVLTGIDFANIEVEAFSIENNYSNPEIKQFMQSHGYELIKEIGLPGDSLDQIYLRSGRAIALAKL